MTEAETTENNTTQDFWTCCICKENGPGTPSLLLSCLHSVCKPCSESARQNDADGADDQIKCGTCGVTTPRYDLIENRFVQPSSAAAGSGDGTPAASEEKICTGCEENVAATSYCIECQEYLCDQCVQAHRRVKVTKEHNIQLKENATTGGGSSVQLGPEVIYCNIHPKEALKLFCETCDKLTCRDCQLSEHKDHKYYFVEEAGVKMRAVLVRFLERMREKKTLVENATQLMTKRSREIQECQDRVSNDIKVFALKIIAEINRRGKSLMEDLTALCNAKKQQLDQKMDDINAVCGKLDHAVKFIDYCTDQGTPEALLYSKRVLVKQLKGILMERCDVPNPQHKLDIRFQWDQNFTSMVPKQGILLVDGINFHTASKSAQQNWIQGMGLMSGNTQAQPNPHTQLSASATSHHHQQQSGSTTSNHHPPRQHHPPAAGGNNTMVNRMREQREQRAQHGLNKARVQQYMMGGGGVKPGQLQPPPPQGGNSHSGRGFLQPTHPGQISPTAGNAGQQPPFLGNSHSNRLNNLMHPPPAGFHGNPASAPSQFNPHQSSAISSSDPHSRNRQGLGPYHGFPPSSRSFQGHPGHFRPPDGGLTLAELQEKRVMMRKQQQQQQGQGHYPPGGPGAPPPSPIVIAPEGEEHLTHLMPTVKQRPPPPSSMGRSSVSPHSSNTSSPVHVGSTTSPEQQQRPRSASSDGDITVTSVNSKSSKLKGEGSERPSCSFRTSPKPSQAEKSDRGKTHPVSISDFTFDQDPMSFIKNINQEIDLNPENTLGLISEKRRTSNHNSSEASANQSEASTTSTTTTSQSNVRVESAVSSNQSNGICETTASCSATTTTSKIPLDDSSPGSISSTLVTGKDSSHCSHLLSTQESSDPNEDWCAVCHNGGDLLCCDFCPKVFHLTCHVPTLKAMPTGTWQCNMCRENITLTEPESRSTESSSSSGATKRKHVSGLNEREAKVCQRILLELYSQETSSPFHQPVSKQVPNYYKVITNPMDFSTIKSRLRRSNVAHYQSVEQFLMDVQTVFTNCARYNGVDSEMGGIGRDVEQFFHNLVRKFLPYIDIQPVSTSSTNNATAAISKSEDSIATATEDLPPKAKVKKRVSTEGESGTSAPSSGGEDEGDSNVKAERRLKLKLKLNNGNISYNKVSIIDDGSSSFQSDQSKDAASTDVCGNSETSGNSHHDNDLDSKKPTRRDSGDCRDNGEPAGDGDTVTRSDLAGESGEKSDDSSPPVVVSAEKKLQRAGDDCPGNSLPAPETPEQTSQSELSSGGGTESQSLPDYSSLLDELPDLVGMETDDDDLGTQSTEKDDPDYMPTVDN